MKILVKTIIYRFKLLKMKSTLRKMKGGLEQCKYC